MVTSHSVALAGLDSGTEHHFRVVSADSDANVAMSVDDAFVTTAISAPRSSRGSSSSCGFGGIFGVSVVLGLLLIARSRR